MNQHDEAYTLSTEAFAALQLAKPQTIRKRLCEHGSYFGVVPRKLPNGRLAWPNRQIGAAESEPVLAAA